MAMTDQQMVADLGRSNTSDGRMTFRQIMVAMQLANKVVIRSICFSDITAEYFTVTKAEARRKLLRVPLGVDILANFAADGTLYVG